MLPTGAFDAQLLARFDGLVLAGVADIDPAHYGQIPSPHTSIVRVDRDKTELELLSAALERDLPVLAICRGMQLLNVALGGDLVQHGLHHRAVHAADSEPGHPAHFQLHPSRGAGRRRYCRHLVARLGQELVHRSEGPRFDGKRMGNGENESGHDLMIMALTAVSCSGSSVLADRT